MALTNEEILEAIASKTVLEISELIKMMEEKFGVSAAAVAAAPAAGAGAGAAEEKTEFDVVLASFDAAAKIKVIKRRNSTSFSNPPVPTRSPSSRSFAK